MPNKIELLALLKSMNLLEYGSVIHGSLVRETLGLVYPEVAHKEEFDRLALFELSAIDYVRNHLLNQGKYLAQQKGDYMILLPSQNAKQTENYMRNADNKLRKAIKLSRNTPKGDYPSPDASTVKAMLKRESIKTEMSRSELNK